jgi:hypothetical protein
MLSYHCCQLNPGYPAYSKKIWNSSYATSYNPVFDANSIFNSSLVRLLCSGSPLALKAQSFYEMFHFYCHITYLHSKLHGIWCVYGQESWEIDKQSNKLPWMPSANQSQEFCMTAAKVFYWLHGWKSKPSITNKIHRYKAILKPIGTFGIQMCSTASTSNMEILI